MDPHVVDLIIAIVGATLASSGFWAFIQARSNKNDSSEKLLLGLAHDRIMYLSKHYLDKGSITADEYENLITYLYEPYVECGGNGSAKHVVEKVSHLQITTS